jgi:hypothetical protein
MRLDTAAPPNLFVPRRLWPLRLAGRIGARPTGSGRAPFVAVRRFGGCLRGRLRLLPWVALCGLVAACLADSEPPGVGTDVSSTEHTEEPGDEPRLDAGVPDEPPKGCDEPDDVSPGSDTEPAHVFSAPLQGQRFGFAVASVGDITGDCIDDIAIGAPGGLYESVSPGHVFVYSGATKELLFQVSGERAGGGFGYSIAPAGDVDGDGVPDFIVGAPWEGEAWVISGRDGEVIHRLRGGSTAGFSVAAVGDVTGDGHGDFALGGPWHNLWCGQSLGQTGAVWLFSGADGELFRVIEGFKYDWFGYSLAAPGDVDGDGFADIAVGSPREVWATSGYHAGAMIVLDGAAEPACVYGEWDALGIVRGTTGDELGSSLAVLSDLDGDEIVDFVIGAPGRDGNGLAHIYGSNSGHRHTLWPFDRQLNHFGISVARAGDLTGDGFDDVIVGAPMDHLPRGGFETGVVHVFSSQSGERLLALAGDRMRAGLGYAVAGAKRGGGCPRVLASTGSPAAFSWHGRVFVYDLPCAP